MSRILFHVQHLLGIGHHRRAERLVRACVAAGHQVTVASGGEPVPNEDWGGADLVHLPSARAEGSFSHLVDAAGRPIDDAWRAERLARTLALFEQVAPDALVLEGFPFARRALRFELLPLLERARQAPKPPLVVVSLRDILVFKHEQKRIDFVVETVGRLVDRILVHGDPALVTLDQTFPATDAIRDKLVYTGYVAPPAPAPDGEARHGVIVSAGGGAVGGPLLRAAIAAKPLTRLADRPWRVVTGPMLAEADAATLIAPDGVTIERSRSDLPVLFTRAELSISQGGYNTVMELLQSRVRAVVVPYADREETEQALRSGLLERAGRIATVAQHDLSPENLAQAVDRALAAPDPAGLAIAMDGAERTAALLCEWLP